MAWVPKIRGENSTTGEDNGIRNQAVGGQTKIALGIPAISWKQKPEERTTCKSSQTSRISNHEVWWIIHGLAKPLTRPACYRWQNSRIYVSYNRAKAILKEWFGIESEMLKVYVKEVIDLPYTSTVNPKKIMEFYEKLSYNVQALDTQTTWQGQQNGSIDPRKIADN